MLLHWVSRRFPERVREPSAPARLSCVRPSAGTVLTISWDCRVHLGHPHPALLPSREPLVSPPSLRAGWLAKTSTRSRENCFLALALGKLPPGPQAGRCSAPAVGRACHSPVVTERRDSGTTFGMMAFASTGRVKRRGGARNESRVSLALARGESDEACLSF